MVEQDAALRQAAGQVFYNSSRFTLSDLRARANRQQLTAHFQAYLDGFSPNVQDIVDNFEFRNQIPRLSRADALGTLNEKLTSPGVNLRPDPVRHADGSVNHPGLDNHGMGTIFKELVRRFNEENNEEAGEHWTPRDAVRLMAKLVFQPIADQITSGTYLLYDGACGTGGMLTVAEETLQELSAEHRNEVATHLYGQEINAETLAICKADLLLKGEGEAADNIVGGPEHSTLSNDANPGREFDFMLSNPPYGKSWRTDLERMGGKRDMRDPRFVIEHAGSVVGAPSGAKGEIHSLALSHPSNARSSYCLVRDIVYAIITRVRVVVDTNVLVAAACSSTGASREVVRRCLLGRWEPLIGQALFAEYEAVLSRSDLFAGSPISSVERYALWAAFVSRCRWVRVRYLWRPNLPDEADNHVVELAVAGGAESIVTFNKRDFERGELYFPGLQIVTPHALIKEE